MLNPLVSFLGSIDLWLFIIVLVFIVLDFISGIIKGVATNDLSSVKMRQGLLHKASYILLIVVAIVLEYASLRIDFGVELMGIIYVATCLWIVLTEVASILENVCVIDPSLKGTKLYQLFGKSGEEKDNEQNA